MIEGWISSDKIRECITEKVITLYKCLDDIVYDSSCLLLDSALVVLSLWKSDSSVITSGACLLTTFILGNQCVVANGFVCSLS